MLDPIYGFEEINKIITGIGEIGTNITDTSKIDRNHSSDDNGFVCT